MLHAELGVVLGFMKMRNAESSASRMLDSFKQVAVKQPAKREPC